MKTQFHWAAFAPPVLLASVALLVVSGSDADWLRTAAQAVTALAVAWGVRMALVAWTTSLTVNEQQVVARSGISSENRLDLPLSAVESIETKKSPLGVLIGYGSVTVRGASGTSRTIPWVSQPEAFRASALRLIADVKSTMSEVRRADAVAISPEAHRARLNRLRPASPPNQDVPSYADGRWVVAGEADASQLSSGRRKAARLALWRPDGEQLATFAGAFSMRTWTADGRPLSDLGMADGASVPIVAFWSEDGEVLLQGRWPTSQMWSVMNPGRQTIRTTTTKGLSWGWDIDWAGGLRPDRGFSPWQPGGQGAILVACLEPPALRLYRTEQVALNTGAKAVSDVPDLFDLPAAKTMTAPSLDAENSCVRRYAWHPTGDYVAVTTGAFNGLGARYTTVLDIASGAQVAEVGIDTSVVGWTPDGRQLLVEHRAHSADEPALRAWDARDWTLRSLSGDEVDDPWTCELRESGVEATGLAASGRATLRLQHLSGERSLTVGRSGSGWCEVPGSDTVIHASVCPADATVMATLHETESRNLRLLRWIRNQQ